MNSDNKSNVFSFLYKREKPMQLNIIGYILLGFSLLSFQESIIISIVIILVATAILLYNIGIEIDFEDKKYRLFTTFNLVKFGEWLPLPDIKYISVFRTNIVRTDTSRAGKTLTTSNEVFQINFITINNQRILIFEDLNDKKSFQVAENIARNLRLKIWNATERDKGEWYDKEF